MSSKNREVLELVCEGEGGRNGQQDGGARLPETL